MNPRKKPMVMAVIALLSLASFLITIDFSPEISSETNEGDTVTIHYVSGSTSTSTLKYNSITGRYYFDSYLNSKSGQVTLGFTDNPDGLGDLILGGQYGGATSIPSDLYEVLNTEGPFVKLEDGATYLEGDIIYYTYYPSAFNLYSLPDWMNSYVSINPMGFSVEYTGVAVPGTWTIDYNEGRDKQITFTVLGSSHDVSFSSNGQVIDIQTVDDGATASSFNPDLDGYTFKGWYVDNTFSTPFDFSTAIIEDITPFAKWEGNFAFTSEPTADGNVTLLPSMDGTVIFDASASQGSLIVWDFGDSTTATGMYQTHYYSQPGDYVVKLMVYNDDGKVDVKEYSVSIPDQSTGAIGPNIIPMIVVALVLIMGGGLVVRRLL